MKTVKTVIVASALVLFLATVSLAQQTKETAPAASYSCTGHERPAVKLTPAQTRSALVERTDLQVPAGTVKGCLVLDVFLSGEGSIECVSQVRGDTSLSSIIPDVEKWKFKAVGKRRDGTLQLCWHNGWEVGNEFSKK